MAVALHTWGHDNAHGPIQDSGQSFDVQIMGLCSFARSCMCMGRTAACAPS